MRMTEDDKRRLPKRPSATWLVRAGTQIVDENGQHFATVTRNIVSGQRLMPEDFKFADGREIVLGQQIPQPIIAFLQSKRTVFEEPPK